MALLTATQIIDQAMQAAGNTAVQTWSLSQLNRLLRRFHRKYSLPYLQKTNETLTTTPTQAFTSYAAITDFWKPRVMQIRVGTALYEVRPRPGGLAAYWADTSRLVGSGRPSRYVLDRANSRIYWADSIPSAAETISLLYQAEQTDLALTDTPVVVTHSPAGEMWLVYALMREIKVRMEEYTEAAALATLARQFEDEVLQDKMDEVDEVPERDPREDYV